MKITKKVLENQVAFINKFQNPNMYKLRVYRIFKYYRIGYMDQRGDEVKKTYGMTTKECWHYLKGISDGLKLAQPF